MTRDSPFFHGCRTWPGGRPGTLLFNVGSAKQFAQCTKLQLGTPEAVYAKVVFREIDGVLRLVVVPVKEPGPDVYEVKHGVGRAKAPVIRLLKPLFASAQITLRPDVWYDMATEIVKDQEHGYGVSGIWTDAVISPRLESEREEEEEEPARMDATGGAAAGIQQE